MKRAIFVTVGTIAGLTATLRYTPDNPLLTAGTDLALGAPQTLGGAQTQTSSAQGSPTVPAVSASKTSTPVPKNSNSAKPSPVKTKVKKPTPTPTKTASPTPTPTKTASPTPTPTKTASPTPTPHLVSATGNVAQAGFYGPVQVSIQVSDGRITSITPLSWPTGETSSSISNYSIPKLINAALNSQSSNVATIGGASYTSAAFRATLASAMVKAGL
jgi:uncharacterized protein with FMN-binding domain